MSAIKLGVAIVGAIGVAILAGGGTKIYDNNKYNKSRNQWQSEKQGLLEKIQRYQIMIQGKDRRITELEKMIQNIQKSLAKTTKSLEETDMLLELLNNRQKELKQRIAERDYYKSEITNMKRKFA